jgi:crotonobetainyl-CoA:carnitine CoA-transferase CaiB-like acyl-CoA transferase
MWNESNAPEMTLGKHCAELDLKQTDQRAQWVKLLSTADVLVHGYRSDALASLGLDAQARQRIRPGLVDVSLDAYGFTGPWANRRGFDSLVQMSIGIAQAGQQLGQRARPLPLPVQALDHATGYLLATAALRGLVHRVRTGQGSIARASLARTGALLLTTLDPAGMRRPLLAPETPEDLSMTTERTGWGLAKRIKWPVRVTGVEMKWSVGAGPLKRDAARWL